MQLKTEGLQHQVADLKAHWESPEWGRFWEMGVGKTWPTLVEAAMLYLAGQIDVLVVMAPKSAAKNWVLDQVPKHLPEEVNACVWAYSIPDQDSGWHKAGIEKLLRWRRERRGLVVLTVSYEAILRDECKDLLKELMRARLDSPGQFRGDGRTMLVADESSFLGNDDSKRTQRSYTLGDCSGFRRILEGTPVTRDPRNVYSQMKFLNRNYWNKYRIYSYQAFTTTFCKVRRLANLKADVGGGRKIRVPKIVGYQNIDKLTEMLHAGASRLTTEQAGIWLPPQTYQRIKFELHPKQRSIYDQLRRESLAWLDEGGGLITTNMAVTKLLRLQQITSGYVPVERSDGSGVDLHAILPPEENPRLEALVELLLTVPGQAIVFARFTPEVDMILAALAKVKKTASRFDGETSDKQRVISLERFANGDSQFLVGKVGAMGRSLTLINATWTVYNSNDFNYGDRAQSEKRIHRIGQTLPCFYYDLEAVNTVDGKIIKALQAKHEIAALVNGDVLREWIG